MASEGDRRAGPEVEARRSKVLGGWNAGDGRRGVLVALASTVVFFAVVAAVVVNSPGWSEVKATFFDWGEFKSSFPEILRAFKVNVKIFCISEALILVFALVLAVIRSLPGPVFFPLRALAIVYTDLFRGIPTILVIALLGFGAPALQLSWVPTSPIVLGDHCARARLHGVRLGGLPRGDRVGPPLAGDGCALARALAVAGACGT